MRKSIVIASGKGGTGKTMITANLGVALASKGYKVVLIDMDTGLRNLDLYMGLENKVVYDVNDVFNGVCRIKQALIKDKRSQGLFLIAASPRPDDGQITPLHTKVLCQKLKEVFDIILIDAPAGIDDGFSIALGGADDVIVVITPEYASLRDAEIVTNSLESRNIKNIHYIINRVNIDLMESGLAPSIEQFSDRIRANAIGIIQDDENIHISTNMGVPIAYMKDTYIWKNFMNISEKIEEM